MKKAPTLKDVASLAGVSPYTVSAVLNGARSNTVVSEATRRRIMESAERVNYHPNAVARSLASRKTYSLGVQFGVLNPMEAIGNSYATGLLQGMMHEAAQHQYNILLYTEAWENAEKSARNFRDRRTDGVILVAPLMDTDMLPALSALPLSLVAISADPGSCPKHVPCVDVDNTAGIQAAVAHLVKLGHTRIAHLTGNRNVASVVVREKAFVDAMAQHRLPYVPEYLVAATYDALTINTLLPRLMALPNPPTAIVAGNDNLALGVIVTARAMGIAVPEQLSVVGFDDIPSAGQVTPALTTVRQPLFEIGVEAVRLLLQEINTTTENTSDGRFAPHLITPTLILRESTMPIV